MPDPYGYVVFWGPTSASKPLAPVSASQLAPAVPSARRPRALPRRGAAAPGGTVHSEASRALDSGNLQDFPQTPETIKEGTFSHTRDPYVILKV